MQASRPLGVIALVTAVHNLQSGSRRRRRRAGSWVRCDQVSTQVATCYRHPERETGLRCQRCERPVCPDCMVPAPVGVHCLDCVRAARSRVIPARTLLRGSPPYVTYGIMAANVAVWLVGLVLGLAAGGSGGLMSGGPP